MDGTRTAASGLTAWQVMVQSACIHPDWDYEMHAQYLVNDEFFDAGYVECLPIDEWLKDPKFQAQVAQVRGGR